MPRIPLAQVPNVPTAPEPVLSQYPRQKIDLSEMAQNLMQRGIEPGSFDGPARGLQAVAEGVGQAGDVFQEVSRRMADAKNQADLSRAEDIMNAAAAQFSTDRAALPEDQWVATWEQKYRPLIEQQLDSLHLSPWARDRVLPQLVHFDATTRTHLAYDAYHQTAGRNQQAIQNSITSAFQSGNFPAVFEGIGRLVTGHFITPEQGEKMHLQYEDQAQRQIVQQAVNADPRGVLADMDEARRTNQSKLLPYLTGKPDEIARVHSQAASLVRQQEFDAFNAAQDDLSNGSTIDEIRQRYGPALPDRKLHILEKAARSYREWDPAVDGPAAEHIRADIANYTRDGDPDLNQLDDLQHRIADLPRNKQGYLNTLLAQQYQKTTKEQKDPSAHDQQLGYWLGEAQRLGQAGFLGPTGRHRKNFNVITDPQQSAEFGMKLQTIRTQLQQWGKIHPEASPADWRDYFFQVVKPYSMTQAANRMGPPLPFRGDDDPAGPVKTVPTTHFSLGTDVGGPDPSQDANTNAGYSSQGPNLTPGAAAVNTGRYPIGTIFRDENTGEVFLATDRHGNADADVVDLYQAPDRYQNTRSARALRVIGRAAHVPRDAAGLRKLLATLGTVPEGESAAEFLARRNPTLARK